jgi:glycine/D-amino acid oxidase-like deaminating enzyme
MHRPETGTAIFWRRVYHASCPHPIKESRLMHASFWEDDAMLDADLAVVGGGLVGLQTALELRERCPKARIMVLERGALPSGASSRNAGFACFGSLTEILHDCSTMGEAAALALVEQRWRGLARLRQRLGDEAIGFECLGGFELLQASSLWALQRLDHVNRQLHPLFSQDVFQADPAALRASGFGPSVVALVRNRLEGQLHAGKLMRSLAALAARHGIALHFGADVQALDEGDGEVHLHTAAGWKFRAARVALCTNGFTRALLPGCDIVPARGQVLITEAIPGLPWRGTYHLERGFFYFRNVGDRVLLGGARHLDQENEACTGFALTGTIQDALENLLHDVILPGSRPRIAQRWAGIMGFSADKKPRVQRVSDRIALGFGCNGMGVALGAEIAAQTAALLA